MVCPRRALPALLARSTQTIPTKSRPGISTRCTTSRSPGRAWAARFDSRRPLPLAGAIERIKTHLGLRQVRVAAADRHRQGEAIESLAVCAGSGGALFEKAPGFDLYLTGELRHHDVLALNARGSSVVLCDHTNTERGYLPRLKHRLDAASGGALEISVSDADREPLVYA